MAQALVDHVSGGSLYDDIDRHDGNGNRRYESLLPPQSKRDKGRLTVILDMDETLLHSEFTTADNDYRQFEERLEVSRPPDFTLRLNTADGDETVHVLKRNGLKHFLEQVSLHFEPILFTAALPVYASPVLDQIDPERLLRHRLYRDATVSYRGENFVKDVGRLGRPMNRIVIVDNNPHAMLPHPDNALPVVSFYDQEDNELEKVLDTLMEMKKFQDIRPFMKQRFRFREHLDELCMEGNY
jgi:Dullard-like phosphatase family protein